MTRTINKKSASSSMMRTTKKLVVVLVLALLLDIVAVIQAVPVQLYGLNYNTRKGADWNPNKCKSREEVTRDLQLLQRLTNRFRILSLTDCGQGELVLDVARQLGLTIWLGLWVSDDENVFRLELSALQDFLDRGLIDDTVLGINVGSESIYREEVTANQIIEYKDEVKEVMVASGKGDVLIAICDIAPTFQYNLGLVSASDIVMTNTFPFWEGVNINRAMARLETQLSPIINFAAKENKQFILGETGWPSAGFIPGVGIAGPDQQTQYFTDFYCRMDQELNWAYYYFTGIDNAWRQEQDKNNTVEGNWGFLYANLTLKPHYQDLSFSCENDPSVVYSFSEMDWAVPVVMAPPTVSPAPISAESCQAHSTCRAAGLFGNCCPGSNGQFLACCDSDVTGGNTITSPTTSSTILIAPTGSPSLSTGSSSTTVPTSPATVPPGTLSSTGPIAAPVVVAPIAPSMSPTTALSSKQNNNTDPMSVAPSSAAPATGSPSTTGPTMEPVEEGSLSPSMTPTASFIPPTVSPLNNNTGTEPASEAPTMPTGLPTTSSSDEPSAQPSATSIPREAAATFVPQPTSSGSMLGTTDHGAAALVVQYSFMILASLLLLA